MKFTPITVTAAVISMLGAMTCVAQTQPPPSTSTPSSASSPSQRDATRSPTAETPATPQSQPSDTSTPHQRSAMAGKYQTMKECMDAQAARDPGMSKEAMTKSCNDQMKAQKDQSSTSKPRETTPNRSDDYSKTPAPK